MSQVYQRICNKRGVTTAAAVADRFLLEFVLTSIGNAYVSINACACANSDGTSRRDFTPG
jgi:hypothetical protein